MNANAYQFGHLIDSISQQAKQFKFSNIVLLQSVGEDFKF